MSEEEAGILCRTGRENSDEFARVFLESGSPENVFRRDEHISIRDCRVNEVSQQLWLEFRYDIDGIVSTLNKFSSIKTPFHFLNILPRDFNSLLPLYGIIKKHLPLYDYSTTGLQYLKWSVSVRLFESDGFEFHISLLPKCGQPKFKLYTRKNFVNVQYEFFTAFRNIFSAILQSLPEEELARGTIKKNRIYKVEKWFILPNDRQFILHCLDEALSKTTVDETFEKSIIAFKFGHRDSSDAVKIQAFNLFDATVTAHAAVTISSPILDQHLLWSRFGIQELIGDRGVLTPALSLSSCCNFQTNLDGRVIDISTQLRQLSTGKLRFLQFYANTPHLDSSHIHPVFGSIISCGVLNANVLRSIEHKAEEYISLSKENAFKFGKIHARFELVCVVEQLNSNALIPQQLINQTQLQTVLETYPILVPISNRISNVIGATFISLLKSIPEHIVDTLSALHREFKRFGGLLNAWKAYQYEVASEVFWKGKPRSYIDKNLGNNLGPGSGHPGRSKTWELGFLCLEDCLSCALGETSIPPLEFHALSATDIHKIRRFFSFSDFLNASEKVLGVRSIIVLLNDFLHDPRRIANCDRSFISDLKQTQHPPWAYVSGTFGLKTLCEKLSVKSQYRHPHVFGRVLELLVEKERDPVTILMNGFQQAKFKFFPDVRFVDTSRNQCLSWPGKRVLKLCHAENDSNKPDHDAIAMTRDVISFLDEHGLVFKSKFATYRERDIDFKLPWLFDVINKLEVDYVTSDEYVRLLGYLTCIALLQNNWFVDYRRFRKLHFEIHTRNSSLLQELKDHEVLSVFTLRVALNLRVNRLHELIPLELHEDVNDDIIKTVQEPAETLDDEDDVMREGDIVHTNECDDVHKGERNHYPVGCKQRWTAEELEILYSIIQTVFPSLNNAYVEYTNQCRTRGIPDRSFIGFKRKYAKMRNK